MGEIIQQLVSSFALDEEEAVKLSEISITEIIGVKIKKKTDTEYLLYIGEQDIQELVSQLVVNKDILLMENTNDSARKKIIKEMKKIFSNTGKAYAADIALFGRMFADDKTLNVDASCQVAHSISSHKVSMDIDYFTAVDDLNAEDETGAGMIGYTEMNGSCHYRYANIDVSSLYSNLGFNSYLTSATVGGFIRSFIESIPTGKQNSMAAHNPPFSVLVLIRDDGKLWNLAGAFSKPVTSHSDKSLEEVTSETMINYWEALANVYGVSDSVIKTGFTISKGDGSLAETLETVEKAVASKSSKWNN